MPILNIRVFVDVIDLLSGSSPVSTVFLFDDALARGEGWGSVALCSPVSPGVDVRWTLAAIDVQTPVWLCAVAFDDRAPSLEVDTPMWGRSFLGRVPPNAVTGIAHPYRLVLGFGREGGRRLVVEGPSLLCAAA
jgi:hypothetical protein